MNLRESLTRALGKDPTESDFATHFADSISAQDRIQRIAREAGDIGMLKLSILTTQDLKHQARELGLQRDKYPSLFRRY